MRASQQIDHTYQINITSAHSDLLNTWSLRYSYWRLLKIIYNGPAVPAYAYTTTASRFLSHITSYYEQNFH